MLDVLSSLLTEVIGCGKKRGIATTDELGGLFWCHALSTGNIGQRYMRRRMLA